MLKTIRLLYPTDGNTLNRKLIAAAIVAAAISAPTQAGLLYTFNYDALDNYAAASINFASAGFADSVGDILTYVSGSINGCAPTQISVDGLNAFATPVFGFGSCGDGLGPDVDGLFFRPDVMPPLTPGVFISSSTAGRQFEFDGGNFYRYVGGSVTIRDDSTVPAPGTLLLTGLALVGVLRSMIRRQK